MASFLLLLLCSLASASFIPKYGWFSSGSDAVIGELSVEDMRARLMKGEYTKRKEGVAVAKEIAIADGGIPASFDSRQTWPNCPTIKAIYDQGSCGSCWAFCTAETMSDRTCIAKQKVVVLSPEDILTCCTTSCGAGCNGGWPINALQYWDKTGVCTGGRPNSKHDCKPYTSGSGYAPQCQQQCQPSYNVSYEADKHYGSSAYYLPNNVTAIQKEIMTNGPVSSTFDVYDDFFAYKSGIYVHTSGGYAGGHCVKTIGWGEENGTPYWLVANSWNTNWGEKGFFRIIRGTNEVNFEAGMAAGLPRD